MSDIVSQLRTKGYQIEQVATSGDAITGISLVSNSITIPANGTGTIEVEYEGSSEEGTEGSEYYAVIKGGYYKMTLTSSGVEIDKTATEIDDGGSGETLTATVTSGTNVTVGEINGNSITINAGSTVGTSVVTVSYGSYSKECTVSVVILPSEDESASASVDINTDYGLVDVIWLSEETNTYSETPNIPNLYTNLEASKRLTPVTWTEYKEGTTITEGETTRTVNWTEDMTTKSTWYSYNEGSGTADNTTSMWANAKNSDGSYFVWIPRYAYRITYYSDASYTNVTGYYDGYGMWKAEDGSKKYDLDEGTETVEHNGNKYIVHPAFCTNVDLGGGFGTKTTDSNGKTLTDGISGIWVAKYEMSRTGATATSAGSGYNTTFLSVPKVRSARSINIGNMYQVSRTYDDTKESHMMKNSEWGAVAYLTQSQYGRNGHEIDINNSSTYITGNGGGAVGGIATTQSGTTNAYDTTTGAKASSTGNIYGIYDLSGGAWEYVAGFDKSGNADKVEGELYGLNMTKEAKDTDGNYISTKYITAYNNGTSDYNSTAKLFEVGKVGDSTKEVRKKSETRNWFSDYSYFVYSDDPFFARGGCYGSGADAGVFISTYFNGYSNGTNSFRVVLGQ